MHRLLVALVTIVLAAPFAPATVFAGGGGHGGVCRQIIDAEPAAQEVLILDGCFRPDRITVRAGTAVSWWMRGGFPHNVTFADGSTSGELRPGTKPFWFRFHKPGVYSYACTIHPGMTGVVEVAGAPVDGGVKKVGAATNADSAPKGTVTVAGGFVEEGPSLPWGSIAVMGLVLIGGAVVTAIRIGRR